MKLSYDRYYDQVLGGWIGKCLGGAAGVPFEGHKGWIEVRPETMFPPEMPPNDDLDLQVLWLKVLEERGAALEADDLAAAWLEGCWYPFNEYGIFRRNWRLGIRPPTSGRYGNQFWETGMGCPIRSEIWGYVYPGAPDLAARYAALDGSLDHTEQSIGAEMMFAAMASMAFFVSDVRRLIAMTIHYLPPDTPVARLTHDAIAAFDEGLSLRDARDRLMMLDGVPEACDAQINVPFTILGLLYGGDDLGAAISAALSCGYDTDCTAATAGALVGQILGASHIPEHLRHEVGDELVMGIEYRRPEMTISALSRDTARMGVLLSADGATGVTITGAPAFAPLPATARPAPTALRVRYTGLPAAAPGETVTVTVSVAGELPAGAALRVEAPAGWIVVPALAPLDTSRREATFQLHAPQAPATWPQRHSFTACLEGAHPLALPFGVAGAGLYRFLGAYYDALPDEGDQAQKRRHFNHHYVRLDRAYIAEPAPDVAALARQWSQTLGRPSTIASYEHEVEPGQVLGLRGPYCAYLARTVLSPVAREANLMVGNTDSYRLYLNGELVAEVDESIWWTPFNNVHRVTLREGPNELLIKLLKRSDSLRFTLGLRAWTGARGGPNHEDWLTDLADVVPESTAR